MTTFNIGDTVRIWDNHETDFDEHISYTDEMVQYAGAEATVTAVDEDGDVLLDVDDGANWWSDRMLVLKPVRFKVGDRVRIWDKHEEDRVVYLHYVGDMLSYAGMEATIAGKPYGGEAAFLLDIDHGEWKWTAPMLSLVSSETNDQCDSDLPEISMADLEAILQLNK